MTEHIVAVFTTESTADAAARDLEQAGFSAIRRYRPGATEGSYGTPGVGSTESTLSDGGGFWAWLLGEEPATETTRSLYRDEHAYDQWAQTGKSVLSVMVDDHSRIRQAVTILEAYHPLELEGGSEDTMRDRGNAPVAGGPASSTDEEVIPLAEESIKIGKRTVDRGATRVRRYVVEKPVERDVTLRGERVTIERRRPLETTVPGRAFEERIVEVRETEEVPVVDRTTRVAEEVVVRKEETQRTETVRDTERREEVEITDQDGRRSRER